MRRGEWANRVDPAGGYPAGLMFEEVGFTEVPSNYQLPNIWRRSEWDRKKRQSDFLRKKSGKKNEYTVLEGENAYMTESVVYEKGRKITIEEEDTEINERENERKGKKRKIVPIEDEIEYENRRGNLQEELNEQLRRNAEATARDAELRARREKEEYVREENYVDISVSSTNVNSNGLILPDPIKTLFPISQGTGDNSERVGRQIVLNNIQWWFMVQSKDDDAVNFNATKTRLMLVKDLQNNGNGANILDVLTATNVDAYIDLDNEQRFEIIWDTYLCHHVTAITPTITTTETLSVLFPLTSFPDVKTEPGGRVARKSHVVEGNYCPPEAEKIDFNQSLVANFTALTSVNYFFIFFGDHGGHKGNIEGRIRVLYSEE